MNTSLLMVILPSDFWVLGVILLGCFLVLVLLIRYRAKQRNSQTSALSCRAVVLEELPELHKYCLSKFGDQISDLPAMELWFKRNNKIFEILTGAVPGKVEQHSIEGYFSVLPLTEEGRKGVAKGIYSGATLPPDSVTDDEAAGAIYVGGVAADSRTGGLHVMNRLMSRLEEFDNASVVYTRPVTQDGLRWVRGKEFARVDGSPIPSLNHLYKKEINPSSPKRKTIRQKSATRGKNRKTKFFETSYGVFQGGGCRASAYVGAYAETMARGVRFVEVAGTSAGSIIAALIAAGATPLQLREIVNRLDFSELLSPPTPMQKAVNLVLRAILNAVSFIPHRVPKFLALIVLKNGLYSTAKLRNWIQTELKALLPGVPAGENVRFEHLHLPTAIVAADLRERKVKVWSSHTTKDFEVADAVCASCSIPFFFQPFNNRYVDGGTLSNLPSFVFNRKDAVRRVNQPILAFALTADFEGDEVLRSLGLVHAVVNTMVDGSQDLQQKMQDNVHTISISTGKVKATDFMDMDHLKVSRLIKNGQLATRTYLDNEIDKIHLRRPQRIECGTQEEVLTIIVERLARSRKNATFAFDGLEWLDEVNCALVCARIAGVKISVVHDDGLAATEVEKQRLRLLQTAGCDIMASAPMSIKGCLFDPREAQDAYAFLQSASGQFASGVLYSGRSDLAAISCIISSFSGVTDGSPKPFSVERCKAKEVGFLVKRLRKVSQYAAEGIEVRLEEVALSNLKCLSKYVLEHRYKQAASVAELYRKQGFSIYEPICFITDPEKRIFLMPPVVERDATSGNYYVLDGLSRALVGQHAELSSITCMVVSGVRDSLPCTGRYALEQVQIVCSPLRPVDRYDDFDGQHFRWLPDCLVCSG